MWGCVVCPLTFTSHVCLVCEGRPRWAGAHDVCVHLDLNWQGCHHPFRIHFLLLSMKQDGQNCPSHFCPSRWNQCGHSLILQTVTRYPSGALFTPVPSVSVRLYQGLSLCTHSARTVLMQWFRTLRLPDSHADTSCELIAQYGWMDGMWWYSMSLCDRCRTASGCATAQFASQAHTSVFSISGLQIFFQPNTWSLWVCLAAALKKPILSAFQTLMWCLSFCNYCHTHSTEPH